MVIDESESLKCIEVKNLQRVDFKRVKIVPGDDVSPFYLDVTYEFENQYGIFELNIPKIRMDMYFQNHQLPNIRRKGAKYDCCINLMRSSFNLPAFIDSYMPGLGLSVIPVPTKDDSAPDIEFKITQIKRKELEMTLEDIEKKLGHKVKIVSGKKNSQ